MPVAEVEHLLLRPSKRSRSRRLRKKLHIDDFQQVGFEYELTWLSKPSVEAQEKFIDGLLDEVINPGDLSVGGGTNCGFIAGHSRSPDEADRQRFIAWVSLWPGLVGIVVSELRDAWYDN